MEEAEELGDRIGIMTSGKLRCVGSPLFLKSIYGAGYNLLVTHEKTEQLQELHDNITTFIGNHIEGVRVRKEAEKEITYFLPKNQSTKFKDFFIELDKNLENLRIESYGMATNTMEEIFLRVAREDDKERGGQKLNANMYSMSMSKSVAQTAEDKALDTYSIANEQELPFCEKFFLHSSAILKKRLIINIRNIGTIINEILIPILLVVFGFMLTKISTFSNSDPRTFGINAYGNSLSVMVNEYTPDGTLASEFTNYFMTEMQPKTTSGLTLLPGDNEKDNLQNFDEYVHNDDTTRYGSLYVNKINKPTNTYEYIVLGNLAVQDSSAAYMGYFSQTLLRALKADSTYQLTYTTAPFPLTDKARNLEQAVKGSIVSNTLVIAFALVPAGIISFIVQEREESLKHQQLISGVSLVAYWLSNGIVDIL
jgi:ATP-binding cassette subfamily A (ABC1) protein 3